jgi:hypothetical protein
VSTLAALIMLRFVHGSATATRFSKPTGDGPAAGDVTARQV